jgi:diguanylate cyclase (GGDEF)-like protein
VSGETRRDERTEGGIFAAAAAAVARGDDLDDQLAELLGLAAEHLGASAGAAYILDQDRDELTLEVTFGVEVGVAEEAGTVSKASEGHDPVAQVTRTREPLEVEDADHVPVLHGAKSALLLPMVVRRDGIELALGVLALGFAGGVPKDDARVGAEPLADLAAVAVERALALAFGAERAEWFDRVSHTDPLTGLPNRRTLDRLLELEVARAGRQGMPLSVALFGVDHFSEIVAKGGNTAGDAALKGVSQVLGESVRLVDNIARFSNDEFILVAPGPDGMVVAQRIVRGVGALAPINGEPVSVSAGIASFPLEGRTPEELLEVAGNAMAAAREAGGARVLAQPPVE